ncbi:MAG: hypothetical protein V8R91_04435 [Butyricimonas faecihominis]
MSTIEKLIDHIHPDDRDELRSCLEKIAKSHDLREFVGVFRVDYHVPGTVSLVGEPWNCRNGGNE